MTRKQLAVMWLYVAGVMAPFFYAAMMFHGLHVAIQYVPIFLTVVITSLITNQINKSQRNEHRN